MGYLYVFQHLVDALLNLSSGEVVWQAHLSRVVEGAFNRQVAVNDIILGHIAKLGAEGGQVFIVILPVIENHPRLRGSQAVEGPHQR